MHGIPAVIIFILLVEVAAAQPEPVVSSGSEKTAEVPTPSGTPEPQGTSDLLPESNQLPAPPPDLRLPSPSILKIESSSSAQNLEVAKQLSPEEQAKNQAKLAELRATAMRNPRVIDLLKDADGALTDEAKREFMRAYYHTLCLQMRHLQPSLDQTITAFERAEIRKLAAGPSHLSIVSRDLPRRERQRRSQRSE
jgi:hypothetical protein